jgi:phage terminase Nu1 subunit (DNA packaging protein)
MRIVTQKEFSELAGVSPPAISKLIRTGKIPVTEKKRIDLEAPECVAYLESKGVAAADIGSGQAEEPPKSGRAAMMAKRRNSPGGASSKKAAVKKGTTISDVMRRRDVEMRKLIADAEYRELKSAEMRGRLVARKVMINGVWKPLETFLVRILSDGAKTISKTVFSLVKSGGTREEVEVAIRQELTSFIVPLKESIQKALKT